MRIYLAARWRRMGELSDYAKLLREDGHFITARWVDGAERDLTRECNAIMDYGDVAAADIVLSFTEAYQSEHSGGGRHVEFGMGYALGKKCVIVGEKEQIFHWLPGVKQCDTFEQARTYLGKEFTK